MVTTEVTIPVWVLVDVTVTPEISAPVESETVPPSVAFVVCAKLFVKTINNRDETAAISRFIFPPTRWRHARKL